MTIRIMLRIVRAFGLIALAMTLSAGVGAFTADLTLGGGEELGSGLRLHIVLSLSAGLLAMAAHMFFVFFLPRAVIGLQVQATPVPGWFWTVLLSFAAAAMTIGAVVLGVDSMTGSFRDALHRGVSVAAIGLQLAALASQNKASALIASAEAEDLEA